ncbi:MAG: helix-turn-helix domain-containing protein [Streptosporangiaceae bacterium]
MGVQPPFVTDIEADRRRPSPEVLGRIAGALDVPLAELEALDPRITPEGMDGRGATGGSLLRRLRDDPDRDELLRQMEQVVDRDRGHPGEER